MDRIRQLKERWPGSVGWIGFGVLGLIVTGLVIVLNGRIPGTASAERAEIEAIVRDYILENPEIIPEAVNRLQQREVINLISKNREAIETPYGSAWAGAKDGDVTLVEFFDYNCPYCRLSHPDVERLLKEDKNLKVVYRDLPVLGAQSREAALASLSAAEQGKYVNFFRRMFADKARVSTQKTIQVIRASGLDEARTARDMQSDRLKAVVDRNLELGNALGLTGTPSYVIGDRILSGAVGYDALKSAIAEARARN